MDFGKLLACLFGSKQTVANRNVSPPPIRTKSASVSSGTKWVPPGVAVNVCGYSIPDGMVYIGKTLSNSSRYGDEPSLINSKVSVDKRSPNYAGLGMNYWPTYDRISPQSRAAYLSWLSSGRNDSNAYIGYVFLFFYGLERRLFVDLKPSPAFQEEAKLIIAEVKRLREIYGGSRSFQNYASSFIEVAELVFSTGKPYEKEPTYGSSIGYAVPLEVKAAIAHLVNDGLPLPAEWALAWYVGHEETQTTVTLKRCWNLFEGLFCIRYYKSEGDGILIKPNKSPLRLTYKPASSGFGGEVKLSDSGLPDPTRLSGPFRKISEIARGAEEDLRAYSRWLGRYPEQSDRLDGLALFPKDLLEAADTPELKNIKRWLMSAVGENQWIRVTGTNLTGIWPTGIDGKLPKKDAVALCQLFGLLGVGVEPDPRFGGRLAKGDEYAILFKQEEDISAPSREYASSTLLLHLASTVAFADGDVGEDEKEHLIHYLEHVLQLSRAETQRLKAHLCWLLENNPGMGGIKKRVESLNKQQRAAVSNFLIGVAAADGVIHPDEVNVLKKLYALLGFEESQLFSDLHQISTTPVATTTKSAIPPSAVASEKDSESKSFTLDMSKVKAITEDTSVVSEILVDIFDDDEEDEDAAEDGLPIPSEDGVITIEGLDATHTALIMKLPLTAEISAAEFEKLAEDLNLMPEGAYETINEFAYDRFDEPLLESTDPIEINIPALKELHV